MVGFAPRVNVEGISRSHHFGGNACRVAPAARVVVISGFTLLLVPLERHGRHSHRDDGNENAAQTLQLNLNQT